MRASKLFIPTLREDPGDAEAVSHKLLVRGGFIRQVSAGLWSFTPLGWSVHRKIEQIVREEMDAIGGQEMLMPVLTPAELWEATGRISIPEIFRVKDRTGRDFVLPLTHEETVTFHAREIQSYRELPQLWYHFQTKDRDEPRPRGGLLRVREFIMKDAYSFDRDEEGVRRSFEANREAYKKIFARCELETYDVQAESGIMGGKFSIDFLAPSGSGENTLVRCENGDYAGDLEVAEAVPSAAVLPEPLEAPEEVETPGVTTIEGLAEFLGIDPSATSKAMPVVKPDGKLVLALVRGDDRLSETKLYDALPGASRPATDEEIRDAFGAGGGSLGPVGFSGEVIADETLREGQFVAGANHDGRHLRGVEAGRDYEPRFADLREPRRVLHRQRPKLHRLDQLEDRGVRPDPERQRHDCGEREAGALHEPPAGIEEVLPECRHRTSEACLGPYGCKARTVRKLRKERRVREESVRLWDGNVPVVRALPDAPLASVQEGEPEAGLGCWRPGLERPDAPDGIALGWLDLDDLHPEVGQQLPAQLATQIGQVQDA